MVLAVGLAAVVVPQHVVPNDVDFHDMPWHVMICLVHYHDMPLHAVVMPRHCHEKHK